MVLRAFAYAICYAGVAFDLLAPLALLFGGVRTRAAATLAALAFHSLNKVRAPV